MMNLKEIGATAAALGNQIGAGIPIDQALTRMAQMQPTYAEFWQRTTQEIRAGRMLSASLQEVWPEALVSAIKAGEQSGQMDSVLKRIEETIELQITLRGTMMQLAYPIGMGFAGLLVFLGFMIFVLPMLAKSIGSHSTSQIFQFSAWLSVFVLNNYITIAIVIGIGLFALIAWTKTPEARSAILGLCLSIPLVKDALRDMYFGLWANYMAMMIAAGISTTNALTLTAPVLPGALRESIDLFERDLSISNKSLSASADISKFLNTDDLRVKWWPFYVSNAFIVAEQTGEIDKELLRIAPALIKEGVRTLNHVIAIANVIAIAVSGFLIVSPMAAYYTEIFSAIRSAGH